MRLRKTLIAFGILLIGACIFYISTNQHIENQEIAIENENGIEPDNSNKPEYTVTIKSTEVLCTAEQLIDNADLIVFGKITNRLEEFDYEDYNKVGDGRSILCSLYNCEVEDVLKGDKVEKVRISFGGNSLPPSLEYDKEYLICLSKIEKMDDDVYGTSINQGIFSINEDELKSNYGKTYKVSEFKDEIAKVEEKNEKGIKILQPGPRNDQDD